MAYNRLPLKDPRTVAREIPGIFDIIFPQLTPGVVVFFNRTAVDYELNLLSEETISKSTLEKAMLFEIAFARGEQLLSGLKKENWEECLKIATRRQKRHFDAKPPNSLSNIDKKIAELVGENLVSILEDVKTRNANSLLVQSPEIPGYQWIASGQGDFAIGRKLIEVKCTARNFSSADYRQILMYWLLSCSAAIETGLPEWTSGILINPRRNKTVEVNFDELISATSAGKSKIEVLELFSSIVGDYALKALPEFRL